MFLSMMSAFAQEESISISKNMRKGAVMRMQNGTFQLSQIPYGYRCDQNGKLVICEEEARVVRYIYERFLQGAGIHQIATQLIKAEVPKLNGKPVWSRHGILYILTNERYMGDELYRKSYRSEEIPFKKIDNHGEKAQFYAENTHEGIISKDTFEKVQVLLQGKSQKFGQDQKNEPYPFSGKLRCVECSSILYRRVTARGIRWVCSRHLHHPDQCGQKGISEDMVQDRFQILLHKLSQNRDAILGEYLKQLQELKDRELFLHPDAMELNRQIAMLSEQNHTLHSLWAKECIDSAFFIAQTNELEQKIRKHRTELQRYRDSSDYAGMIEQTKRLISLVSAPSDHFDPEIFRKIVEQVIVSDTAFVFQLKNGLKLEETRKDRTDMSKKRIFPFGYQMRDGQILVNPQEARLVREIFEQYRLGKTTPELAASAMLQGVPYREGTATWNKNMVCRILDDARYTGTEEYPPIVEQALYDAVCARRSGGRKKEVILPKEIREKIACPKCGRTLCRTACRNGKITWGCPDCGWESGWLEDSQVLQQITAILTG